MFYPVGEISVYALSRGKPGGLDDIGLEAGWKQTIRSEKKNESTADTNMKLMRNSQLFRQCQLGGGLFIGLVGQVLSWWTMHHHPDPADSTLNMDYSRFCFIF